MALGRFAPSGSDGAPVHPIAHNLSMVPEIQYAVSADGTRIACYKIGQGPPLLEVESLPSHLLVAWQSDFLRRAAERFSRHYTVIKFDRRGSGLSQRGRVSQEIDDQVADIAAVLDRLEVARTSIHARGAGGASAIAFAASYPERLDRLVLWSAFAAAHQLASGQLTGTVELLRHDYTTYTETIARTFLGWAAGDAARDFAAALRAGQTQDEAIASMEADIRIDVRDRLHSVQAPTLVVHVKDSQFPGVQAASELAAAIPNARLAMVEGETPSGTTGWASRDATPDREAGGRSIDDAFLSGNPVLDAPPLRPPTPTDTGATMVARASAQRSFAAGRYAVRRTLGEGGQKIVYLVHDEALDRDCALSMVKPELLEPDDLERLRREAQAMARLGAHSNIVTVHDIGEEDGKPYLVCEYVPAGELRRHLRDAAPLPLERALAIAADVARALAVAHGRGVIHRDVKPANVWLCDDGSAKLGDFGLAFSIDRTRVTIAGTIVGTATYMAPEQARGEPADARTDLYALGVMLYEMVCGRPPFSGDDPLSVISQHASVAPLAPAQHAAGLPPALNDLIVRLLAKSPEDRPQSAAAVGEALRAISEGLRQPEPADPEPEEPEALPAAPGFVGRTPELEQLTTALDRAIAGAGSLVMVVGEPGIGKTRLLEQFGAHARGAGPRVLWGRCYDGDWAPPFSPFVEAIKQHGAATTPQRLRADLGADAGVLARIVPALHERLPNIPEPPTIPPDGERYRLLEAVSDTLGRLAADRPLVLILDDLHWADRGTIAMLQHVARASAGQRVLLLGAYRDVELDRAHPLSEALTALRREKHFERILLRGLDGAEVAELLDTIAEQDVPAPLAEAIARETEGNPFFIKEVLLHLVEEKKIVSQDGTWASKLSIAEMGIPEGVREVIGRRLSRVSEACGRMLTVASALTAGFSWDVISAISDAADAALLDAIDEALGAHLIVERERGRYDFTHALIRHTLYEELSTPRRVLLHRQIGEALERLYAPDIEPHVAEFAHHFYEASPGGDVAKAAAYAKRAGDQARAMAAWDEAIAHAANALHLMETQGAGGRERCEMMLSLGDVQGFGGGFADAAETYLRAAQLARELADAELLGRAAWGYAGPFHARVGVDPLPLLQEGIEALPDESVLRARLMSRLAVVLPFGDPRKRDLNDAAEEIARRANDDGALGNILSARFFVFEANGPDIEPSDAVELADEVIRLARACNDVDLQTVGLAWRLGGLIDLGDMAVVDAELSALDAFAEEIRWPSFWWWTLQWKAARALLAGEVEASEEFGRRASVLGQGIQNVDTTMPLQRAFLLLRAQGRLREIEPIVRAGSEQFPDSLTHAALAFIYAEVGDEAAARAAFERVAALGFGAVPRGAAWFTTMAFLSSTCSYLGDADRAGVLYDILCPYAHRCPTTAGVPPVSGILGLLAAAMGRHNVAVPHFEDAMATEIGMGARPWLAETQLNYALMLRKREAPADAARARELLDQALATAREIGMAKVAADCEALLTSSA